VNLNKVTLVTTWSDIVIGSKCTGGYRERVIWSVGTDTARTLRCTFIHERSRIHGHLSNTPPLELRRFWGASFVVGVIKEPRQRKSCHKPAYHMHEMKRGDTEIVTDMDTSLKKANLWVCVQWWVRGGSEIAQGQEGVRRTAMSRRVSY
jgi:hypothetical protein